MIIATRKKARVKKQKCDFKGRSYRNYNKQTFQNLIINAEWNSFLLQETVTGKWNEMLKIIYKSIDNLCPVKSFKIKQIKEAWITPQLLELIKDKDHALKKAKKKKDPELWKNAKRLRNNCTKRLRDARAEFIKDRMDQNMGDSKKFWKNIQEVIPNKKSNNRNIFNLLDISTKEMIESEKTADFINDYFTNIGPNLAKYLRKPWSFIGEKPDEILDELLTNEVEILELCKGINTNKSSSIEHLSSEIIRDAFE